MESATGGSGLTGLVESLEHPSTPLRIKNERKEIKIKFFMTLKLNLRTSQLKARCMIPIGMLANNIEALNSFLWNFGIIHCEDMIFENYCQEVKLLNCRK